MKSTNKEQNDALRDKSKAVKEVIRSCLYFKIVKIFDLLDGFSVFIVKSKK